MVARPRAVALPIPLMAPVTSTVVPAIGVAVNVFHTRGPQAAAGEATTGVVDETVRFEGAGELLNPLAISHTPMNSSHRPPGIVWMRLRLKPITSNTDPPRMTA